MNKTAGIWNEEKASAFYADYSAGILWRELVDSYDMSMNFLMKKAREKGLPRRNIFQTPWALEGGYMRPWLHQREDLCRLIENGYSEHEIANSLRRTYDGVRHELARLGYPTSRTLDTEMYMMLYKAGLSRHRIAELVGHCVGERRVGLEPEEKTILMHLDSIGATNSEIAATIGVRICTVFEWRKEYEIAQPKHRSLPQRGRTARADAASRILPDGFGGTL